MLHGLFQGILGEQHREERRKLLRRSKISDILFYSSAYDYRFIRILLNFPIGFAIAYMLYKFGWFKFFFILFSLNLLINPKLIMVT